jgi:hypothetical protein
MVSKIALDLYRGLLEQVSYGPTVEYKAEKVAVDLNDIADLLKKLLPKPPVAPFSSAIPVLSTAALTAPVAYYVGKKKQEGTDTWDKAKYTALGTALGLSIPTAVNKAKEFGTELGLMPNSNNAFDPLDLGAYYERH